MNLGPGKLMDLYRVARLTSADYSVPKGSLGIIMGVCEHFEPEAYEVQWIERGGLSAPVLRGDLEHVSEIFLPKPEPPKPTELQQVVARLTHDDWAVLFLTVLDADPAIHEANVRMVRKRYPPEKLPGAGEKLFAQPYAAWCKVNAVVQALLSSGSRESPIPPELMEEFYARLHEPDHEGIYTDCSSKCDVRGGAIHAQDCPHYG